MTKVEPFVTVEALTEWLNSKGGSCANLKIILFYEFLMDELLEKLYTETSKSLKQKILLSPALIYSGTTEEETVSQQSSSQDRQKAKKLIKTPIINPHKFLLSYSQNLQNLLEFCLPSTMQVALDRNFFGKSKAQLRQLDSGIKLSALSVTIISAKDLQPKDVSGTCDPFCEFGFIYPPSGSSLDSLFHAPSRSRIRKRTLNPLWNVSRQYCFKNFPSSSFLIRVVDHGFMSSSDALGYLLIDWKKLALIEREGEREFPISADFVGATVAASASSQAVRLKKNIEKVHLYGKIAIKWKIF